MNTNAAVAIVTLIIGLAGGYFLGIQQTGRQAPAAGMHMMSDGSTMADAMAGMTASLEGKTGDAFDRAFIEEMIVHHEGAVVMAQQALQSAQRDEIKQMAQDIIAAQTREIATMREWLQSWYGIQQ